MVLISVIIPVYKVEKYIKQCVDSVLNQSFKDIEVILVDDGSPDKCPRICDEYAKKDGRVKVVHKKNGGLSDARNYGIKAASGEYLMFIDSDDYWENNNCLDIFIEKIKRNMPDLIMYKETSYYVNTNKYYPNKYYYDLDRIQNKPADDVINYLIRSNNFSATAWSVVVKKSIVIENNIYFTKGIKSEDIDWSINLFLHVKSIDAINDRFLIYRKNRDGSITNTVNIKNAEDLLFIIEKWSDNLNKNEYHEQIKIAFRGYLAYQYSILMHLVSNLSKEDKDKILERMKHYSFILNYAVNKKATIVKRLNRVLKFSITMSLLGVVVDIKEKVNSIRILK